MTSGERWRLGHRTGLDGLRGVAILVVLIGHGLAGVPAVRGESTVALCGVAVFFALSGFLITTLLLERRDATGLPGFGVFYRRRARRLLPAVGVFLLVLAVASLWWPWLVSPGSLLASVFYLQNVQDMFFAGGAAGHLWSLSVEEQFYLLWPLALMFAVRRGARVGLAVAVGVLAVSAGYRLALAGGGMSHQLHIYFGSDTNAGLLAAGCVTAFAVRAGWSLPRHWFWPLLVPVGAALAVQDRILTLALFPIIAAGLASLAVFACAGTRQPWTPSWLNLVGRRSYGLYLWHFPLVVALPPHLAAPLWITVPVAIVLAWGLTCLSWTLVEQPILRARRVPLVVRTATAAA